MISALQMAPAERILDNGGDSLRLLRRLAQRYMERAVYLADLEKPNNISLAKRSGRMLARGGPAYYSTAASNVTALCA